MPNFVETFSVIRSNFKLKPTEYSIDNWVFKLHYRVTVLLFLISTILVTSRQYIGEHIRCISDKGVPDHVMNTFCFFTSTFTVPYVNVSAEILKKLVDGDEVKALDSKLLDSENLAHPGVGPYGINTNEPIVRHAYYQWVPFVLFGQAIMFYLTHLLWKHLEGGRLKYLCDGLKLAAFALTEKELSHDKGKIPSKEQRDQKILQVREGFIKRVYINKYWSYKLIFCEVVNVLHVILQIYITNEFLGKNFYRIGTEVWNDGLDSSVDVLDEVFPKITKCTFHKYGPSGSIQHHDAMCVMALNIINDKIYTCLWFWFLILFVCSLGGLLWRFLTILLHSKSSSFNQLVYANTCPGKINPWNMITVSKYCNFTDWLFLKYLSKNVDGMVFREILIGLAEELEVKNPPPKRRSLVSSEEGDEYQKTLL